LRECAEVRRHPTLIITAGHNPATPLSITEGQARMSKAKIDAPSVAGTSFEGGLFVGVHEHRFINYALILAPKKIGQREQAWWRDDQHNASPVLAHHVGDGAINTSLLADAGSAVATWALGLDIDGYRDWYLPSRNELHLVYRRATINASNLSVGVRLLGVDSVDPVWHLSSSEDERDPRYFWAQALGRGTQSPCLKASECMVARAVRRVKLGEV
jgi:hypothetical protein